MTDEFERRVSAMEEEIDSGNDGDSSQDNKEQDPYHKQERPSGGQKKPNSRSTKGKQEMSCVQTVPWSSVELLGEFRSGRSGSVVAANFRSQLVGLKLFDVGKHGNGSFLAELACYKTAQTLQGISIPRLVFVTHSPSGNVAGLGLEFGRPLPDSFSLSTPHRSCGCDCLIGHQPGCRSE